MEKNQAVIQELTSILERKGIAREELDGMLSMVHPVDIAFILEDLTAEEKVQVFRLLDMETAAAVLVELDDDSTREVVNLLPAEHVQRVLAAMTPDDAASTVRLIAEEKGRDAALAFLSKNQRGIVKPLLHYGEQTAGALMTTNFIAVPVTATAAEAVKALQGAVQSNTVIYIYPIDSNAVLKGVLSLRTLLRASPDTKIADIMTTDPITLPSGMDQEEVVRIVKRYSLQAVPVVDPQDRILGVVTLDSLMEVMQQEAGEDMLRMAGADIVDSLSTATLTRFRMRLPWLLLTLGGELFIALVLSRVFRSTLERAAILGAYIPAIAATGGNIGLQSTTIIIRMLGMGRFHAGQAGRVLFSELRLGILLGLTCGALAGVAAALLEHNSPSAVKLGVAVFLAMVSATSATSLVGALEPLVMHRLKLDPATACGPFVTMFNDLFGTFVFFTIAHAMSFTVH